MQEGESVPIKTLSEVCEKTHSDTVSDKENQDILSSDVVDEQSDGLISGFPARAEIEAIWASVQDALRMQLGERTHKSWTEQLSLSYIGTQGSATYIELTTPSHFSAHRIDEKYGELVKMIWQKHNVQNREFVITICAKHNAPSQTKSQAPFQNEEKLATTRATNAYNTPLRSLSKKAEDKCICADFNFDNFVVDSANELAYAAARTLARNNSQPSYNLVVIYGAHGMGKTHLLHAAAGQSISNNRVTNLVPAEQFVSKFIQAVRSSDRMQIETFKNGLRQPDLLVIDDVQFITNKPGSQDELMHTIIALQETGRQILLSMDCHPYALDKLTPRLKSILCGGLLCDIGTTNYELRARIIDGLVKKNHQAGRLKSEMPENARQHLASINATPRDLEGAFNQILARIEFLGRPLTLESIQTTLSQSQYSRNTKPSIERIQSQTAKQFGVDIDDMLSKSRTRNLARPRQVAMYLCKQLTTRSLPDIGRRFGNRDHTTVIHAVRTIGRLRAQDDVLDAHIELALKTLQG